jgi:RNA polymerase sigma-70 factor (ECF subfamily)
VTTLLTGGSSPKGSGALDDDVDLERDRALVIAAQAGDRSAFDDLYLRYYRRLHRFCLQRLDDTHDAEDTVQESFARAWRALPEFSGDKRFYPWLSVIAWHLCTDVLRRRGRSTPVAEFHPCHEASTEGCGEELAIDAVDSALAAKAFQRLSARHQRILNLREGSGWSYQRIADHEGVRTSAVETLLWRARQALRSEFASLAGTGRSAWIGVGLLSSATLRRLLGATARVARRATIVGPGAVTAVGSAATVAAVVIAVTLGSPSPSVLSPHRAPTAAATVPRPPTPVTSADPTSGPGPSSGPPSTTTGAPGAPTSSVTGPSSPTPGSLGQAFDLPVSGLSPSLQRAAQSVSQVLSQVESVVSGSLVPSLGAIAVTGGPALDPGTTAQGLGPTLGGLAQTLASVPARARSTGGTLSEGP